MARIQDGIKVMQGKVSIFVLLLLLSLASLDQSSYGQEGRLGSVHVSKSVPRVTPEGLLLTSLLIRNNGSVPIFDLEDYEYYNKKLTVADNVTIRFGERLFVHPSGRPTGGQFIVPLIGSLAPGETVAIEYWSSSQASGDFPIPPSLLWFSYRYDSTIIRSNTYSNGFIIRVPNPLERTAVQMIPYVVSIASFIIILWAMTNIRKHLYVSMTKR